MSKSYASELVKGVKTPGLALATRIEERFGYPASAWHKIVAEHSA